MTLLMNQLRSLATRSIVNIKNKSRAKTLQRVGNLFNRRPRVAVRNTVGIADLAAMTENDARRQIINFTKNDIKQAWQNDRYIRNYFLNLWECETGAEVLESYPWNISLPIADLCNARCTFCNSWLRGDDFLSLDSLKTYAEVLPYARLIGIQGHGEPLANPQIDAILRTIAGIVDKRAQGYIITNGAFLEKHLPLLLNSRITVFNVSLNATTAATHDVVMGLGPNKLGVILDTIREIIRIRDTARPELQITISMVLTADNIHEAADFVQLGNELKVNRVYLRSLMPMGDNFPVGLNYHLLSPILNQRFEEHVARMQSAITSSDVPIESQPETWAMDALSKNKREQVSKQPPRPVDRSEALRDKSVRFVYRTMNARRIEKGALGNRYEDVYDLRDNPYQRSAPFGCRFVYHNLIITQLDLSIHPCCYMSDVPGHHPMILTAEHPFMTYWNSDAMVDLRRRLQNGPLFQACATCPMQG